MCFKCSTVDCFYTSMKCITHPGFFTQRIFLALLHNDLCSVYVDMMFMCTWCLISSRYHVTNVYFEGPFFKI